MQTGLHFNARWLAWAAGAVVLFVAVAQTSSAFGWGIIGAKIRHDFPEVKSITTLQLAAWLKDGDRRAPVLLDVRTGAEYDVSHLATARQIEPAAPASVIQLPKNAPIVTYCSVGYRSAGFAQRLQAAGFTNVQNLEGSIFRWANEGRPLYRDGELTDEVHPYNGTWGLLLQRHHRAHMTEVAPN